MVNYNINNVQLKRFYSIDSLYFITSVTKDRKNIFTCKENIKILLNAFDLYRKKLQYKIIAYIILPNHFHCIIMPSSVANISKIMQSIKGYSAREINKKCMIDNNNIVNSTTEVVPTVVPTRVVSTKNKFVSIWQHQFLDHMIRKKEDYKQHIEYIHFNPIKHKIVGEISDYPWSSYRNYYQNDDSILKIDRLQF